MKRAALIVIAAAVVFAGGYFYGKYRAIAQQGSCLGAFFKNLGGKHR